MTATKSTWTRLSLGAGSLALACSLIPSQSSAATQVATGSATEQPAQASGDQSVLIGRSVRGRPITAWRQGSPNAARILLVVGQMHGDEPAGMRVVDELRRLAIATDWDIQIWTIRTMNPDGAARGTRANARGVDLNRNFPNRWRRQGKRTRFYSGPQAGSEPETKAMMAFVRRLNPTAVISFHQPLNTVFSVCSPKNERWVLAVGQRLRLPVDKPRNCSAFDRRYRGTMNDWASGATDALFATAELPASPAVNARRVTRTMNGLLTLAQRVARS